MGTSRPSFTASLIVVILAFAALFALDLLVAQMIAWGLSLYHIDSGIWGPYLLAGAAYVIVALGATIGHQS